MDTSPERLRYGVTLLWPYLSTALHLCDVLAQGSDAAVELGEVLGQRPKATRGARQSLPQHDGGQQHAEQPGAATNAQPKRLGMRFPPLKKNGPVDLIQLRREGGALSCAPSADAVAGNAAPLNWGRSAHAVAGNEAMDEDHPQQQQKDDATDLQ
jgi:hypothetical protein